MPFKLVSPFQPTGDQPEAIAALQAGLENQKIKEQILHGATGTGKTFTIANVIAQHQRPTLVLTPNKTLAAQLYAEFKTFFPDNAVHYFVSYFDYYQPEAYKPQTDLYIEQDSDINDQIDQLRHAATAALFTRDDVLIVASVSCIYALGSKQAYLKQAITLEKGKRYKRPKLIEQLTAIRYERNDLEVRRGTFRLKGEVLDIFPAHCPIAYRVEFSADEVERIREFDPTTAELKVDLAWLYIFPASHYVSEQDVLQKALPQIRAELKERVKYFEKHNCLLESQRLQQRVAYDLEMIEATGYVKGIANYSRYFTQRKPDEKPVTLFDFFPKDFLFIIDESHLSVSQVRGMYMADRTRKQTLVDYGFRLPSALDNRPLNFKEFEKHLKNVIYLSATPGEFEKERCPEPVEQVIRPTGLLDPQIEIRPIAGQIDDLLDLVKERVAKQQRVLITTLTINQAENLHDHLKDLNIKVQYIHSKVNTLDRVDILRDLRQGVYDVLVGINLLREGLDLPEVSLVIILDADKEGFLRSPRSLIQTIGRAARHSEGLVVMYADVKTDSIEEAIKETNRRRKKQMAYNAQHNITPQTVKRELATNLLPQGKAKAAPTIEKKHFKQSIKKLVSTDRQEMQRELEKQMHYHAANLEFEQAAEIRDYLKILETESV